MTVPMALKTLSNTLHANSNGSSPAHVHVLVAAPAVRMPMIMPMTLSLSMATFIIIVIIIAITAVAWLMAVFVGVPMAPAAATIPSTAMCMEALGPTVLVEAHMVKAMVVVCCMAATAAAAATMRMAVVSMRVEHSGCSALEVAVAVVVLVVCMAATAISVWHIHGYMSILFAMVVVVVVVEVEVMVCMATLAATVRMAGIRVCMRQHTIGHPVPVVQVGLAAAHFHLTARTASAMDCAATDGGERAQGQVPSTWHAAAHAPTSLIDMHAVGRYHARFQAHPGGMGLAAAGDPPSTCSAACGERAEGRVAGVEHNPQLFTDVTQQAVSEQMPGSMQNQSCRIQQVRKRINTPHERLLLHDTSFSGKELAEVSLLTPHRILLDYLYGMTNCSQFGAL
eukprot:scaffold256303_cov22-Tisochrysis_lutea.AAC.3